MATNKYSVRGEADMKQHDSAIKKSASEVYKYKKQVEGTKADIKKFAGGVSDLVGKFGKFVPAIAAVSSATAILNNTIKATQTTSDAFDITVNVMKDSIDSFFVALSTGDFKTFLDGLTDVIEASKEVAKNLDELGTKQIFLDRSTADYNLLKAEQNKIIYDKNSTKEQVEAAKAKLREATEAYRKEQEALAQEALKTAASMLQDAFKKTGANVSNNTINKIVGDINLYHDWQKKYLDYEAQKRQFRINKGNALDGSGKSYWQSRIDEINNSNSYKIAKAVYNTSDEKLKEANGHYINARNIQTQMINDDIAQMRLEQRVDNRFNKSTKSTTSKSKEREEIEVPPKIFSEEADLIAGMYTTISEANKKILDEQLNSLPALEGHIEVNEELAKLYAKENDLLEEQHELLDLQVGSIYSLASSFSNLGDAFDNTGLKAAGIITQAVATLIEGYTKAMSSWAATASPWAWIGFSVAGLATLTSVISQIHSLSGYASGGIIQGANTIGDYNLARVNSGEMILNGTQQARLFSLLNSPITGNNVSANNQVEFKIKGQDLVGIITNYNKKVGRVL